MFTDRQFLALIDRAYHRTVAARDAGPHGGTYQEFCDRQAAILRERWEALFNKMRRPRTGPPMQEFYLPDDIYELVMEGVDRE